GDLRIVSPGDRDDASQPTQLRRPARLSNIRGLRRRSVRPPSPGADRRRTQRGDHGPRTPAPRSTHLRADPHPPAPGRRPRPGGGGNRVAPGGVRRAAHDGCAHHLRARPPPPAGGGNAMTEALAPAPDPPYRWPQYRSTELRAPNRPLIPLPLGATEHAGPVFGHAGVRSEDADLTRQHRGDPLGERIIVTGRVTGS